MARRAEYEYELHNFSSPDFRSLVPHDATAYRPHYKPHDDNRAASPLLNDAGSGLESKKRQTRAFHGWRFGALSCATSSTVVFLINLVITIWGSWNPKSGGDAGILYTGDCEKVRQLNVGIHVLINILSTVLLSGSNYCMQCLSAPTRKEIDEAHAKGVWLDVGIPSVRNLDMIKTQRFVLWLLLGFSSLPLHLFYNSAVFSTLGVNEYVVLAVSPSFVESPVCRNCENVNNYESDFLPYMHSAARRGELDRLDNLACIDEYAQALQTQRRNLLLVVASNTSLTPPSGRFNGTDIYAAEQYSVPGILDGIDTDPYEWICLQSLSANADTPCMDYLPEIRKDPASWAPLGDTVDYCLSERSPPDQCSLRFTKYIAILVTVLNLLKAAVMCYVALGIKENPVMTMGDAVASFLEKRDLTTRDMCLLSMRDARHRGGYFRVGPKQFEHKGHLWKDVVSKERWWTCFLLYISALVLISGLLVYGILGMKSSRNAAGIVSLGLGKADPRTIITGWRITSTVGNTLIANMAQPILSVLYFTYNALFTCMVLGLEWSRFAHRRRGLRVSSVSQGAQRSTYFLQLPYRFAVPLMALSATLHWLVSQSIYLVAIEAFTYNGSSDDGASAYGSSDYGVLRMTCGYSPIGIIGVLILGTFMVVAGIGAGYMRYEPGMPLASSCSAAMAAACHAPGVMPDGELMWGVMSVDARETVAHCAFSDQEVRMPNDGEWCAGKKER